jgi:hypothetical protein
MYNAPPKNLTANSTERNDFTLASLQSAQELRPP